jgi:predicted transcriptional regulator
MNEQVKLTVRIEEELLTRLHIVARKKRTNVSTIIRDFVQWYVDKEERGE